MITIKNLSKEYGHFKAVDSLSLEIKPGEIFAFLGVNGAGKTTTIRMLTGILRPTCGTIVIGGHDISSNPIAAKQITGYIPDRPYLYPKLTGREFLYFIADLYRVAPKDAEARIDCLLSDYSLTDWQDEMIESYSHGMKQRLATCSALIHQPQVLIVDEPMVGLDPHGAKMLKERFRQYARSGMTVFLSTHSLNVAEEVADRLAIIHRGKLVATGTLAEVRLLTGYGEERLEELFLHVTGELDH